MLQTHPHFNSLNPNVKTAEEIDEYLYEALNYQHTFEKRTTPWEAQQWDYEELQRFNIDLEKIDRLYYIFYNNDGVSGGRDFKMIARMDNDLEKQPIYLEMFASCDYTGFDCQGSGHIFISKDANLFMKLVLSEAENDVDKSLIYDSLWKDSIYVEEMDDDNYYYFYDKFSNLLLKKVPMLKYICHEAIYQNRDVLYEYKILLPKILRESVLEFINTKDAIIAYNS